jgi:polyisoprenoid-binding protein YceI
MKDKIIQILILWILCVALPVYAAVPAWQIIPEKSTITFTGTQNNAPVLGSFKKFAGIIYFDPTKLNESHVQITIDTASISTAYGEIADTLKTTDWFNVKVFPQAIFKSNQFIKLAEQSYQAKGMLTIRDKTQPVTLTFDLLEYTKTSAHVTGSITIKRIAFGVGQGEWSKTDEVKDDVNIKFDLFATTK